MPVPEAAVNENDGFVFGQNNVGFAGKVFNMQPVPEALCEKKFPDQHFGLGVFALNAAHVVTPYFWFMHIHTSNLASKC